MPRLVSDSESGSIRPRSRSRRRQTPPAKEDVDAETDADNRISGGGADDGIALCDKYFNNCTKLGVPVDPSVYISLQTQWEVLKPSSHFAEGDVLPLIGVLERAKHVRKLNLEGTGMADVQYRAVGNGNSNARALVPMLRGNPNITELNMQNTGLDDDGLREICRVIESNTSMHHLNLSFNNFTSLGAKALQEALQKNSTLKTLDLSNNQLGFESIQQLECSCQLSGLVLEKNGNFVFEEILNATSHGVAFIVSIVGGVVLMNAVVEQGHATDYHYWACMVYSFSLIYLFLASTCYHGSFMMKRTSEVMQVLDNIGIYMLIAGTYTPLLMIGLHSSPRAFYLLLFEWICAACCSCFAIYADLMDDFNCNVKLASMLAMGAACLLIWVDIVENLDRDFVIMLVIGGAGYVCGIPFFILAAKKPIYHTIWHLFVIFAAAVHWFGTYHYIIGIDIKLGPRLDAWVEQASIDIQDPMAYAERLAMLAMQAQETLMHTK